MPKMNFHCSASNFHKLFLYTKLRLQPVNGGITSRRTFCMKSSVFAERAAKAMGTKKTLFFPVCRIRTTFDAIFTFNAIPSVII